MKDISRRQMLIDNKNNFKIPEGLAFQTFDDISHILISPSRDDYTEFHSMIKNKHNQCTDTQDICNKLYESKVLTLTKK
jgi:hypothetical protein